MTRINCIPVQELTDQHLLAEYREITRISKLARVLTDYGTYKLGEGHVKFFYNKGQYLKQRTNELYEECKFRGFNIKRKIYRSHPAVLLEQDWIPDESAIRLNRERIEDKIRSKPEFYTNRRSYLCV